MKKREHRLFIRVTDEERNRILDKMYGMGIHSLSAYIRKMALDGYCLNLDLPQLRRMAYLLQNCSNNLNQVAKRANENGKVACQTVRNSFNRLPPSGGIFLLWGVIQDGRDTADRVAQKQGQVSCGLSEKPHRLCAESR